MAVVSRMAAKRLRLEAASSSAPQLAPSGALVETLPIWGPTAAKMAAPFLSTLGTGQLAKFLQKPESLFAISVHAIAHDPEVSDAYEARIDVRNELPSSASLLAAKAYPGSVSLFPVKHQFGHQTSAAEPAKLALPAEIKGGGTLELRAAFLCDDHRSGLRGFDLKLLILAHSLIKPLSVSARVSIPSLNMPEHDDW